MPTLYICSLSRQCLQCDGAILLTGTACWQATWTVQCPLYVCPPPASSKGIHCERLGRRFLRDVVPFLSWQPLQSGWAINFQLSRAAIYFWSGQDASPVKIQVSEDCPPEMWLSLARSLFNGRPDLRIMSASHVSLFINERGAHLLAVLLLVRESSSGRATIASESAHDAMVEVELRWNGGSGRPEELAGPVLRVRFIAQGGCATIVPFSHLYTETWKLSNGHLGEMEWVVFFLAVGTSSRSFRQRLREAFQGQTAWAVIKWRLISRLLSDLMRFWAATHSSIIHPLLSNFPLLCQRVVELYSWYRSMSHAGYCS